MNLSCVWLGLSTGGRLFLYTQAPFPAAALRCGGVEAEAVEVEEKAGRIVELRSTVEYRLNPLALFSCANGSVDLIYLEHKLLLINYTCRSVDSDSNSQRPHSAG